ncbi:MAG: apolipoprotein N-acyltransferase, partial [Quisquiliibacterium sp.]
PWMLAALAVVLFAGYLALFPVVTITLAARLAPRLDGFAHALLLAAAWGMFEWLRGVLFTGFPWLAIGYAHVDGPLAGYAPWLGVYGIGAVAALTAALLAQQFESLRVLMRADRAARPASGFWPVAAAAGLMITGAGLGTVEHTFAQGPAVKVRLVQGNVPQQMKFDPMRAVAAMQGYADSIEPAGAALIVLPETAWTVRWSMTPPEIATRIGNALARTGAQVAIGMPMRSPGADASGAPQAPVHTNSVALIAARGQTPTMVARYDKQHLVPFGEFIPAGFGWFVAAMRIPLGQFGRGREDQGSFEVAGQRFAFNICYEDLFGEEIVRPLRQPRGPSVLVNVSNIAWFGDSQALPQHLAIARMRSLETGRPMLRATNTGVTASIDHHGQVLAQLAPFAAGVLEVTVQGTAGLTPYARLGNLSSLALFAIMAIAAFVKRGRNALRNS